MTSGRKRRPWLDEPPRPGVPQVVERPDPAGGHCTPPGAGAGGGAAAAPGGGGRCSKPLGAGGRGDPRGRRRMGHADPANRGGRGAGGAAGGRGAGAGADDGGGSASIGSGSGAVGSGTKGMLGAMGAPQEGARASEVPLVAGSHLSRAWGTDGDVALARDRDRLDDVVDRDDQLVAVHAVGGERRGAEGVLAGEGPADLGAQGAGVEVQRGDREGALGALEHEHLHAAALAGHEQRSGRAIEEGVGAVVRRVRHGRSGAQRRLQPRAGCR